MAAVIWDYYDSGSEAGDNVAAGLGPVLDVMHHYLTSTSQDLGVSGIDFADWLNGATCSYPAHASGLASLASARDFPWSTGSAECLKPHLYESVRIVEEDGELYAEVLALEVGTPEWASHGELGEFGLSGEPTSLMVTEAPARGSVPQAVRCDGRCALGPADPDRAILIAPTVPHTVGASWIGADALEALLGDGVVIETDAGAVREYIVE